MREKKTQYVLDAKKADQRVDKPGSKPVPYLIPVYVSRDAQFLFIPLHVANKCVGLGSGGNKGL